MYAYTCLVHRGLALHEHIKHISHCCLCSRYGSLTLLSITHKLHERSKMRTYLIDQQTFVNDAERAFSRLDDTTLCQVTLL